MNRSITTKRLCYFSIFLLLLAVTPAVYGQAAPTASAEQIQALQKKLDELQSQMADVQGELQRLSGGTAPPSHVPADLPVCYRGRATRRKVQGRDGTDPEENRTRHHHHDLQVIFARPIRGAAYQQRTARSAVSGIFSHTRYKYPAAHWRVRQDGLHLRLEARGKCR